MSAFIDYKDIATKIPVDSLQIIEHSVYDTEAKRFAPRLMLYALAGGDIFEYHGTYWYRLLPINSDTIKDELPKDGA